MGKLDVHGASAVEDKSQSPSFKVILQVGRCWCLSDARFKGAKIIGQNKQIMTNIKITDMAVPLRLWAKLTSDLSGIWMCMNPRWTPSRPTPSQA